MTTYITSLPLKDNDGKSTILAMQLFLATLENSGDWHIRFATLDGCFGIWYDQRDNKCYSEETLLFYISTNTLEGYAKMRRALAQFGKDAKQKAVLCVERKPNNAHILAVTQNGLTGANALAIKYGGATLFPSGTAVSYDYAAIADDEYDSILS